MSVADECADHVRVLAGPRGPDDSIKALIRRAARVCGLTPGQVKRLWYGEWKTIPAEVADRLRERRAAAEARQIRIRTEALKSFEALEALVDGSADPEFYREQFKAAKQHIRDAIALGSENSPPPGPAGTAD